MSDFAATLPRRDFRIIGVIGTAHFTSHFFQLALPPLFPILAVELHVGFGELGLVMTLFFLSSAVAQVGSGFLVDRFGPNTILPAGITLLGLGFAGMGFAPGYWAMLPLAMLAGCGNSVFHPADYSVLTSRVSSGRIARAYAVHTVSGTLGWAAAPVTMLLLADRFGWRGALIAAGLSAVVLGLLVGADQGDLRTGHAARHAATDVPRASFRAIASLPVVMAFVYFTLLAMSLSGAQSFFPTLLPKMQHVTLTIATTITTAYLVSSALGSLAGGYLADLVRGHDRVVAVGLASGAGLNLALGFVSMPVLALFAVAMTMGFLVGLTIPSRDMIVRAATPPGATGKVFGFVYSGLDLGSLMAPLIIGFLIDHDRAGSAFVFMAGALACTIVAAVTVRQASGRRDRASASV